MGWLLRLACGVGIAFAQAPATTLNALAADDIDPRYLQDVAPPDQSGSDQAEPGQKLECLIRPSQTVRLGTSVGGVVKRLDVDRGDWVEQGSIIGELENDAFRALLDVYSARAADRSRVTAAEKQAVYLKAEYQRVKALNDDDLISDAETQKAKTDWLVAAADLKRERTALVVAAHERDKAAADLEQRIIRAPVSGVITDLQFVPGEYWPAQEAIVTIAAINELHIEAFAGIDLYGSIKVGDTATIYPQQPIGGSYQARVDVVDTVLDAASHTFDIRLSMPNDARTIPAGIKCDVRFGASQN